MGDYNPRENRNPSLKLMGKRLGISSIPTFGSSQKKYGELLENANVAIQSTENPNIIGISNEKVRFEVNGGILQQERMIYDKRRSLDKATLYSYQAALIKNVLADKNDLPARALINPDKNKFDYDDKIVSIGYEYGLRAGDIFEWLGTKTYWLVYLQDIDELAYFRGEIRRCSYEIAWKDENGEHSTFAAVRGPVETKIDYIQKHQISVDEPNHSLHIYVPRTKEALEYFRRYSKFYLKGEDEGSPKICWRVEATDWISTPGILEITAVEYYINETEDDTEKGIVGGLIAKPINPNSDIDESAIVGDTFIKPKITYTYVFNGIKQSNAQWKLDKKYPIEMIVDKENPRKVTLKWKSNYSGQIILSYGIYNKTIVIESLF